MPNRRIQVNITFTPNTIIMGWNEFSQTDIKDTFKNIKQM